MALWVVVLSELDLNLVDALLDFKGLKVGDAALAQG